MSKTYQKPKDINHLNLICSFEPSGYGVVSTNILKELDKNYCVSAFPRGKVAINNKEEEALFRKVADQAKTFDYDAPCLKIWPQHQLHERVGKGKFSVFPIFELNSFSDNEIHQLQCADQIIVASRWAANVVKDQTGCVAHVAPLGVDTNVFKPSTQNITEVVIPDEPYIFLNAGKWELRKGHDVLVKIFNKAFTKKDNVQLWMMPNNYMLSEQETNQWINYYKCSKLGDKIFILPRVDTNVDVANIIETVHCGIFPSRGEGWNMELLEMLAMGKHVIATNYSAHTEFCTQKSTHLVEVSKFEETAQTKWYHYKGEWPTIDEDQFINHMRECYKNKKINNTEGVKTGKKFTWENCVNKIRKVL